MPITYHLTPVGIVRITEEDNFICSIHFMDDEIEPDQPGTPLLKLAVQQMDEYQKLRATNMQSIKPLFNDIRSAKENFYNLLYVNNLTDSSVNKAADVIGEKQMVLDMHMFSHFKNVRNLCTPEELPKFDSLFKKVVEKMTGGIFTKSGKINDIK